MCDAFSLDVLYKAEVPNVTFERDLSFDVESLAGSLSKVAIVVLFEFVNTN